MLSILPAHITFREWLPNFAIQDQGRRRCAPPPPQPPPPPPRGRGPGLDLWVGGGLSTNLEARPSSGDPVDDATAERLAVAQRCVTVSREEGAGSGAKPDPA
ncbi:hypothetical protein, partial [Nocardia flavorosea]|uniref:hypothetical protein n=1 Tax=Nocardia flavorosea TaxID=53429 RepID=UPI002454D46B